MSEFPGVDEAKIDEALARIPHRLCKYTGISGQRLQYAWDMIANTTIWAAQARSFNDPLDCAIPPLFEATEDQIRQKWTEFVQRELPNASLSEQRAKIDRLVWKSQDPEKVDEVREAIIAALTSRYGLVSLTPSSNDVLMWSYYAEGHSGICLMFNTSPEYVRQLSGLSYPMEVDYPKEVPNINYYTATDFEFIKALLGTKSFRWKHEEEWRLLFADRTGAVQLPEVMLQGIVFGRRTSQAHRIAIQSFNDQRNRPVPLYEIRSKGRNFELEAVLIWEPESLNVS